MKYEIGFVRREWKYVEVEASNKSEAIEKARDMLNMLNSKNWEDYKSEPEVAGITEKKETKDLKNGLIVG
jgi:hypothetical protein